MAECYDCGRNASACPCGRSKGETTSDEHYKRCKRCEATGVVIVGMPDPRDDHPVKCGDCNGVGWLRLKFPVPVFDPNRGHEMSKPGYPSVHQDIETAKTAIREARSGKEIVLTDALATVFARVIKDAGAALSTAYELAGICPPGDFSGLTGQLKKALLSIDD